MEIFYLKTAGGDSQAGLHLECAHRHGPRLRGLRSRRLCGRRGHLTPAILGLFPLPDPVEAGVLAQGELWRFFAETAWYPTALLPSQGVHWEAVDDRSAKATLADGKVSAVMLVNFGEAGLIESLSVEARAAMVGKAIVMSPWEARMSNYQMRDGMLIPLTGEASWLGAKGRAPYWRGTISSLTYEFYKS